MSVQKEVMMATTATLVAMTLAPTNMAVKMTMTVDTTVTVTHTAATTSMTAAMMALDLHTVAAPAFMLATTEPTMHSKLEMMAPKAPSYPTAPKAVTTVVKDKPQTRKSI